ncbi:MAG: dienelactone hydrolase family protein [Verrucomicrobiaceae bacterium]|nr:MAG: dienelactone hydrolase family protein [Verrucomicrobiaceae bacterium]
MNRQTSADFDQELLNLYDDYAHGRVSRRTFLDKASKYTVGGMTALAILEAMSPNYAFAQQVAKEDARLKTGYAEYDSPKGGGRMKGYLARPAKTDKKLPAVLVVHENRGLNPYIEDVARRVAVEGFLAFAPDALTPLGGYPGNDDKGRELQAKRDSREMQEDFIAAAQWLKTHPESDGKVGVIGFCYGGMISNVLAAALPDVILAAVPFYGRQPAAEDAARIKGSLLMHYGELDQRVNEGRAAWNEALKKAGVSFTDYVYPKANHGFHNDTTPRYDEAAAKLAWTRTVEFLNKTLKVPA